MFSGWQKDLLWDLLPFNDNRGGGRDFIDSLTYYTFDPADKGKYQYLMVGNLVSYITLEKTGKTPLEYAEEKVFPLLGITEGMYEWYQNLEGVSTGYHGLRLTPEALSKLPMLYLQQGMANENDEIITADFVDRSFTNNDVTYTEGFGYHSWWLEGPNEAKGKEGGEPAKCSYGFGGQRACVNYNTGRAFAIMSQT